MRGWPQGVHHIDHMQRFYPTDAFRRLHHIYCCLITRTLHHIAEGISTRTSLSERGVVAAKVLRHDTFLSYSAFAQPFARTCALTLCDAVHPHIVTRGSCTAQPHNFVRSFRLRHLICRPWEHVQPQENIRNPHPYDAKTTTLVGTIACV